MVGTRTPIYGLNSARLFERVPHKLIPVTGDCMFITRPDVVDKFASNFRSEENGQILFQPRNAEIGLPITLEEYDAAMSAFEKRQKIDMALTWVITLGATGYGGYKSLSEATFEPFFIALGLAFFWSFMVNLRGHLDILLPFIEAREELQKAVKLQAELGEPVIH